MQDKISAPKVIIGLGNPGAQYTNTRHNIGFRIIDQLAENYSASWQDKDNMQIAKININNIPVTLIKPQTFMNNSGKIIPFIQKQGITPEQTLVIHDELEKPFGFVDFKSGGSSKGHNGLKSIIASFGDKFLRLRFGISRPDDRAQVADYVLQNFKEKSDQVDELIIKAINLIENLY